MDDLVAMHNDRVLETWCTTEENPDSRYRHVQFFDFNKAVADSSQRFARPAVPAAAWPCPPPVAIEPETAAFLEWLLPQAGVNSDDYRKGPLVRRLSACMRTARAGCLDEARGRLCREPDRLASAISSVLIGVTAFFRDTPVFDDLDQVVIPILSENKLGLRVWSAGCANGAELYSVAMLLSSRGLLDNSVLVGTDCRTDALAAAERGWFDRSQLAGLAPELLQSFFVPDRDGWHVCDPLRRATCWRRGNLLEEGAVEGGAWDLILCRNVAIYLEPSASSTLWTALARGLRSGGILVTGKAERPPVAGGLVRLAPCIYQNRGDGP